MLHPLLLKFFSSKQSLVPLVQRCRNFVKMYFNSANPLFPCKCFHMRCWGKHTPPPPPATFVSDRHCTVSVFWRLPSYLQTSKQPLQASAGDSHPEAEHHVWDKGNPQAPKILENSLAFGYIYVHLCLECYHHFTFSHLHLTMQPSQNFPADRKTPQVRFIWRYEIMYKAGIYSWVTHLESGRHI